MRQIRIREIDKFKGYYILKDIFHQGQIYVYKNTYITDEVIHKLLEIKDTYFFNLFIDKEIHYNDEEMKDFLNEEIADIGTIYINSLFNKYSYTVEGNDDKDLMFDLILEIFHLSMSKDFIVNYLENVFFLNNEDFYHVIRVTILSIILAVKANLPKQMIFDIGIGAVIHDIGKIKLFTQYPILMDRNHYYTYDEYQIIKTHPVLGYEEIIDNPLISTESKKIVLMHHVWEDFEASYSESKNSHLSYPRFYKNNEITAKNKDIAVRIVQVANYYDTLTHINNVHSEFYKKNKLYIIKYIKDMDNKIFGGNVAKLLYSHISMFGIGDMVVLSNNEVCEIVSHTNMVKRPIVKTEDGSLINLNENKQLSIVAFHEDYGGVVYDDDNPEQRYYHLQCF